MSERRIELGTFSLNRCETTINKQYLIYIGDVCTENTTIIKIVLFAEADKTYSTEIHGSILDISVVVTS